MIFRKKKPDYEHIARLEREIAEMDTLGPETEEAVEEKRGKRKEFFTPPILERKTYFPVVAPAYSSTSVYVHPQAIPGSGAFYAQRYYAAQSQQQAHQQSQISSLLLGVPGVNIGD